VVFLNIHDIHHDPDIWGDAEVFRPERFLDESGTKLVKHEELMQFGAGIFRQATK
jgi:methyl farnesoate epoxidase/farnesoate epoxidase